MGQGSMAQQTRSFIYPNLPRGMREAENNLGSFETAHGHSDRTPCFPSALPD